MTKKGCIAHGHLKVNYFAAAFSLAAFSFIILSAASRPLGGVAARPRGEAV